MLIVLMLIRCIKNDPVQGTARPNMARRRDLLEGRCIKNDPVQGTARLWPNSYAKATRCDALRTTRFRVLQDLRGPRLCLRGGRCIKNDPLQGTASLLL